ncbi:mannitol dehydrogenase family protein [Brytella acorum]|uniref:Mannitol dehydrogenase family protein n=1 Tax=Brytella acorum TaxID=2959299 RepID=A0AA35V9I6_9PROT|nr:mannitol dehydrogenase family protein [Brytella acorum]MDF3625592.1 mannitol dehydrogenase family protein [Brytella acorum]CAI9119459.1 mannitol dehydrogenase family protein [Brytella acorum]
MIDLNSATLAEIPPRTRRFAYDRSHVRAGIVHLSVGNFHRAHQAWYIDRLLEQAGQESWGIVGVGLLDDANERLKIEAFPAQDDLYTLTRYAPDGTSAHQVIGSLVDYLFAPRDTAAVLDLMSDPSIRIVSMTITEGGYNQDSRTGGYDLSNPVTQAELAAPHAPKSAFGYIVEALRRRRDAGLPPFTVLSCDNLRDNGVVAHTAVLGHARALDVGLADWIEANVTFPSCMVDRITPAVLKPDADRVNEECGVHDRLPVISEDFAQWVIEDRFCQGRPPLEIVGAQLVDDVHPYELAKVRMLNASHSMLAYPGQLAGLESVRDAVEHPLIHKLVHDFMTFDVMPILSAPKGMDLGRYRDTILARFSNPRVGDRLSRITGDGASKLPTFLLPTLATILEKGGETRRLAFCIACFLRYLGGQDDRGEAFDPFEPHLDVTARALGRDPAKALVSLPLFADVEFRSHPALVAQIADDVARIRNTGTLSVLKSLLETLA